MKKYSPFLILILVLAVRPCVSSGTLDDSGIQATMFRKIRQFPVEPHFQEPRSSAVIARIFVPDI